MKVFVFFLILAVASVGSFWSSAEAQTTTTSPRFWCYWHRGDVVPVTAFATAFAPSVVAVHVKQADGSYRSWFRVSPSLATVKQLEPRQVVCTLIFR